MGNKQGHNPVPTLEGSIQVDFAKQLSKGKFSTSLDGKGNLYILSAPHRTCYILRPGSNVIEWYAGRYTKSRDAQSGLRTEDATFAEPTGIEAYDPEGDGRIWIADRRDHTIRLIHNDMVEVAIGVSGVVGLRDGRARLLEPKKSLFSPTQATETHQYAKDSIEDDPSAPDPAEMTEMESVDDPKDLTGPQPIDQPAQLTLNGPMLDTVPSTLKKSSMKTHDDDYAVLMTPRSVCRPRNNRRILIIHEHPAPRIRLVNLDTGYVTTMKLSTPPIQTVNWPGALPFFHNSTLCFAFNDHPNMFAMDWKNGKVDIEPAFPEITALRSMQVRKQVSSTSDHAVFFAQKSSVFWIQHNRNVILEGVPFKSPEYKVLKANGIPKTETPVDALLAYIPLSNALVYMHEDRSIFIKYGFIPSTPSSLETPISTASTSSSSNSPSSYSSVTLSRETIACEYANVTRLLNHRFASICPSRFEKSLPSCPFPPDLIAIQASTECEWRVHSFVLSRYDDPVAARITPFNAHFATLISESVLPPECIDIVVKSMYQGSLFHEYSDTSDAAVAEAALNAARAIWFFQALKIDSPFIRHFSALVLQPMTANQACTFAYAMWTDPLCLWKPVDSLVHVIAGFIGSVCSFTIPAFSSRIGRELVMSEAEDTVIKRVSAFTEMLTGNRPLKSVIDFCFKSNELSPPVLPLDLPSFPLQWQQSNTMLSGADFEFKASSSEGSNGSSLVTSSAQFAFLIREPAAKRSAPPVQSVVVCSKLHLWAKWEWFRELGTPNASATLPSWMTLIERKV